MHSRAQCPQCDTINSVITQPISDSPRFQKTTVGTYAEIKQNRDCDVCQFVAKKLIENPAHDTYGDACAVQFWRWGSLNNHLYYFGSIEGETNCLTCDLDHCCLALVDIQVADLDPCWIDLDRVRAWAKACDKEHAGICHDLKGWQLVPHPYLAPLILVDVVSKCLVDVAIERVPDIQYVALSYVWGRLNNILETTRANERELREKHALSSPSVLPRLPDTVRDAIELVHRLGIPYLWVDRLCIVQDDIDRKLPQLEQMGTIYTKAYMTLVAADGNDASYGLRGSCPGVTAPRVLGTSTLTFSQSGKTLTVEPEFASRTAPGEWHRRGWTFQERTLSNRNLVFQRGRVFWECRGAIWTEELAYGPSYEPAASNDNNVTGRHPGSINHKPLRENEKSSAYSIPPSRWPDLRGYEVLVRSYSELLLTFPSDGLSAFTGILNTMSRAFPGGMLYGLPEYFFDFAILWAPYIPIRRRLVNGKPDPALPSWSWAGWDGGGINLSIAPMTRLRVESLVPWDHIEIYPMIDWRKVDSSTRASQGINNGYHEAAKLSKDRHLQLPQGWSRYTENRNGNILEGFTHNELPGEVFLWPLETPDHSLQQLSTSFDPYLRFKTSRAFLCTGTPLQSVWEERVWSVTKNAVVPRVAMLHLHNLEGNWAGIVVMNECEGNLAPSGEVYECIVVSGGIAWKDDKDEDTSLEEWAQSDAIKSLLIYEFYNVLFIEWNEGIAYRTAVGRVWKEAWGQLDTSDIDVVLG